MDRIDRAKVRKAFDRGACRYEDTVMVQKLVIERITADLMKMFPRFRPLRILDVGAGTGMLLRSLRKNYPEAFLAGLDLATGMASEAISTMRKHGDFLYVAGDAEKLPFADGIFDLVVSTSTYQWLSLLEPAFSEVKRVLASGGLFMFALFGEGTLFELKSAYQCALTDENAEPGDPSHRFFSQQEVLCALEELCFHDVTVENCLEKEYYPDVSAFLRALKGIGAGTPASPPAKGLGGRKVLAKMMEHYQRDFSVESGIPVSYEVVYGKGRKG
jgi:malonyl-CoA O-methyltransferase